MKRVLLAVGIVLLFSSSAFGQSLSNPKIEYIKKWKIADFGRGMRAGQLFAQNDKSISLQVMCPRYEYSLLVRLVTTTRFVGAPTGVSMGQKFVLSDKTAIRTRTGGFDKTELWHMDKRTRRVAQHRHPHFFINLLGRSSSKELQLYVTRESGIAVRRFDTTGFEKVVSFLKGTSRCH